MGYKYQVRRGESFKNAGNRSETSFVCFVFGAYGLKLLYAGTI